MVDNNNDELAFLSLEERGAVELMREGYALEPDLLKLYKPFLDDVLPLPVEQSVVDGLAGWGALVANSSMRNHELHPDWAADAQHPECTHCGRRAPATILECPYGCGPGRDASKGFPISDDTRLALAALREAEFDIVGHPEGVDNAAARALAELARDKAAFAYGVGRSEIVGVVMHPISIDDIVIPFPPAKPEEPGDGV